MSPNTERVYRLALEAAGLLAGPIADLPTLELLKAAVEERLPRKAPPQQTSSLEAWLARIEELWKQGLGPRAIYDRLRLEDEQNSRAEANESEFGGELLEPIEYVIPSARESRAKKRARWNALEAVIAQRCTGPAALELAPAPAPPPRRDPRAKHTRLQQQIEAARRRLAKRGIYVEAA